MNAALSSGKIEYHDRFLWLAAYPVAAVSFIFFANDNSFTTLVHLPTFITDLFFALTVTFAVGIYIHWLTRRQDKLNPWHQGFKKRLVKQLFYGVILPLLVSMCLEAVYLYFVGVPLSGSSMLNLELPLSFIFLVLANLFYLVSYLYQHRKTELVTITKEVIVSLPDTLEYITIQKGFTEERLDIRHCALIISSNKVLWLHTYDNEQYRLRGTLEEWEERLGPVRFYRVNRQCLAALKAIQSVEQTDTRKLKVNFVIPVGEIYVSKLNVVSFRKWWKKEGPL